MTDSITVTGVVASDPQFTHGTSGVSITRFRLASTQRRFDKASNSWVDGDTNWYNISAFRRLSDNLVHSLHKSDRVIVSGRLRVRAWDNGEKSGTAVDIDADTIGHDLFWGTATFSRVTVTRTSSEARDDLATANDGLPEGGGWSTASPSTSTDAGANGGAEEGAGAAETDEDQAVDSEDSSPFGDSSPLVQHYAEPLTVNS